MVNPSEGGWQAAPLEAVRLGTSRRRGERLSTRYPIGSRWLARRPTNWPFPR